ncbi:hypothetical protein HZH66_012091 [Vespula vulgaris]|uniref:Uncharacterized protein n=1 Tax=Vespula vulgaris TaxID=7454 RepID=A0A834MTU8_VESVU|nr:hypothetical protein HZH66_012091 [Vespula vulgaris]
MLLFAEREELEWDGDIEYEIDELRSELSVRLAITLAILFYCILTETIMKKQFIKSNQGCRLRSYLTVATDRFHVAKDTSVGNPTKSTLGTSFKSCQKFVRGALGWHGELWKLMVVT